MALAVVFGKNEKDNLTSADGKAVAAALGAYRAELGREWRRGREGEAL